MQNNGISFLGVTQRQFTDLLGAVIRESMFIAGNPIKILFDFRFSKDSDNLSVFVRKSGKENLFFMLSEDRAKITKIKKEVWFKKSKSGRYRHRFFGPAFRMVSFSRGQISYYAERWLREEKLHREDGPAIISSDKICYNIEGKEHRLDGPAVITPSVLEWLRKGKLHREDGPASIGFVSVSWHKRGKFYKVCEISSLDENLLESYKGGFSFLQKDDFKKYIYKGEF